MAARLALDRHPRSHTRAPPRHDTVSGRKDGLFRFGDTSREGLERDRLSPLPGTEWDRSSWVASNPSFSSVILPSRHQWRQIAYIRESPKHPSVSCAGSIAEWTTLTLARDGAAWDGLDASSSIRSPCGVVSRAVCGVDGDSCEGCAEYVGGTVIRLCVPRGVALDEGFAAMLQTFSGEAISSH